MTKPKMKKIVDVKLTLGPPTPVMHIKSPVQLEKFLIGDKVNHPSHYNKGKIECIEYLEDQFMTRPHEWSAVKYITRADAKGREVEDLEKAIWYLRRKISLLRGDGKRPNDMPQERA